MAPTMWLLSAALVVASTNALTWILGPEAAQPYPAPQHPYQFPDAAIALLEGAAADKRLMFWSDGDTYRVVGDVSEQFPHGAPSPATPVLSDGPNNTYDGNGNWLLHVHRVDATTLIGFTHSENHVWNCSGGYGEWNSGAVVSSGDDGITWTRDGLAIYNEQPCNATFGGSGYSSVLPNLTAGSGFIAYGGCTGYRSGDKTGKPGSWFRYFDGHFGPQFSEPGIDGMDSCLPGVPSNTCCPIVHYNYYLAQYVMVYTTWGNDTTLFIATSLDGVKWGNSSVLLQVGAGRSIAYGQVVGPTNMTQAGEVATLVYAAAPPTGPYPRDFIARSIQFVM